MKFFVSSLVTTRPLVAHISLAGGSKQLRNVFLGAILSGLLLGLNGCKEKIHTVAPVKWVTAHSVAHTTTLYFKGALQPIKSMPVFSSVNGVVRTVFFQYGMMVQKDQPLVSVQATQLIDTFRTAVSDYLEKKAEMDSAQTKYDGDKALYHAGVLSRQDFTSSENSYATSILNFNQSQLALEKLLLALHIAPVTIEKLQLSDTQHVAALLKQTFSPVIVTAPMTGIALIPAAHKSPEDTASSPINVSSGMSLKTDEPIVAIGDPSGYCIMIQVSELDIMQIHPGLSVTVTGDAFPHVVLHGVVKQVAAQADLSQAQSALGISFFNVLIDVPNVSIEEQKKLRIGMTAKVAIAIQHPPQVMLPIAAITNHNGQLTATVFDPKSHQTHPVVVVTGVTTQNEVAILAGIKAGEQVVVRNAGV